MIVLKLTELTLLFQETLTVTVLAFRAGVSLVMVVVLAKVTPPIGGGVSAGKFAAMAPA